MAWERWVPTVEGRSELLETQAPGVQEVSPRLGEAQLLVLHAEKTFE